MLIAEGCWPASNELSLRQNLRCIVDLCALQAIAPDEPSLFLHAPPFHTVCRHVRPGDARDAEQWAISDIEPSLTVPIADFGMGSDTSLALDYRADARAPTLIRLEWRLPAAPNRWVAAFPDFAAFARWLRASLVDAAPFRRNM
ncbi:MAG: hypothetical protein ACREO3_07515 [Arenimonas sp.]